MKYLAIIAGAVVLCGVTTYTKGGFLPTFGFGYTVGILCIALLIWKTEGLK